MNGPAPAAYAQSALQPGGPVAELLLGVSGVLVAGAGLVFIGVMLLLALALRRRGNSNDGRPVDARWWIGGGGLLLPGALLVLLFFFSGHHPPPWRALPAGAPCGQTAGSACPPATAA